MTQTNKISKLSKFANRISATAGIISLISSANMVVNSMPEVQASEIVKGHAVRTNKEVNIAAQIIAIDRSELVNKNYLKAVQALDDYTEDRSKALHFEPVMFGRPADPSITVEPTPSIDLTKDKQANDAEATFSSSEANDPLDELEQNIGITNGSDQPELLTGLGGDANIDVVSALDDIGTTSNEPIATETSVPTIAQEFGHVTVKEAASALSGHAGDGMLNEMMNDLALARNPQVEETTPTEEDAPIEEAVHVEEDAPIEEKAPIEEVVHVEEAAPIEETHSFEAEHQSFESPEYVSNEAEVVDEPQELAAEVHGIVTFDIDVYFGQRRLNRVTQSGLKVIKHSVGHLLDDGHIEWEPVELTDQDIIEVAAGEEHFDRSSITTVEPRVVAPESDDHVVKIEVLINRDNEKAKAQRLARQQAESTANESTHEEEAVQVQTVTIHFVGIDVDNDIKLYEFDEIIEYESEEDLIQKVNAIADNQDLEAYKPLGNIFNLKDARIESSYRPEYSDEIVGYPNASVEEETENHDSYLDPELVRSVADEKLGSIQSLSNRAEYSRYTSFNDFSRRILDKNVIAEIVFDISEGAYDYSSSDRVLKASEHTVKLVELNKRFEDKLLYRLNDFRRSLDLPEFTNQRMSLSHDRMLASHAIYNYLAANHSNSIVNQVLASELGMRQSETMQPARHLKIAGQFLTPEAAADSMYRAIISEAANYTSSENDKASHLAQLLDRDNLSIAAAMFVGNYEYNYHTSVSDYTISTTLQYYKY